MNLFLLITDPTSGKHELITPSLDGTILPGVTRDSVLSLARTRLPADSYYVSERAVTMPEVARASEEGRLREVFGTGTAVVISPVKSIGWKGRTIMCGLEEGQEAGLVASLMKEWIEGIQYGEVEHEWSFMIE
jgi:branched-chain amino acid aminotransferase